MKPAFYTLTAAACIALSSCGMNYEYSATMAGKMDDRTLRREYQRMSGNAYLPKNMPLLRAYEDEMERRGLMPKARE